MILELDKNNVKAQTTLSFINASFLAHSVENSEKRQQDTI